jgi:hypothetical protein
MWQQRYNLCFGVKFLKILRKEIGEIMGLRKCYRKCSKGLTKSQSSLEFILSILIGLAFFSFFLLMLTNLTENVHEEGSSVAVESVANEFLTKFSTAKKMSDGYSLYFELPEEIDGATTNYTIHGGKEFVVFYDDNEYLIFLPSFVVGSVGPGQNQLLKEGGVIGFCEESCNGTFPLTSSQPISCYNGLFWQECSLEYGQSYDKMRAECFPATDNASLIITNREGTLFNNESLTEVTADIFEFEFDFNVNLSGDWTINMTCQDDVGIDVSYTYEYYVPYGTLSLLSSGIPASSDSCIQTGSTNFTCDENKNFSLFYDIKCLGGECGTVESWLDPIFGCNLVKEINDSEGSVLENYTLDSDTTLSCFHNNITTFNGTDKVLGLAVEGDINIGNATFPAHYDNLTLNVTGELTASDTNFTSPKHPVSGKRGFLNFEAGKNAEIRISDATISKINKFFVYSNDFLLQDVTFANSSSQILLVKSNSSEFTNVISNESLIINKSVGVNITNSTFRVDSQSVIRRSNVSFSDGRFFNSTQGILRVNDSNATFANVNFDNVSLLIQDSRVVLTDYLSNISTIDDYEIWKSWTISYNITNLVSGIPIINAKIEAENKTGTLVSTKYTDSSGGAEVPLLSSINKSGTADLIYPSNYTVGFSRSGYISTSHIVNVTGQQVFNIKMESLKGIVQVGSNCTSSKPFCTQENPYFCEDMTPGDVCKLKYIVNATSNGAISLVGKNFTFFILAQSDFVNVTESDMLNISIR